MNNQIMIVAILQQIASITQQYAVGILPAHVSRFIPPQNPEIYLQMLEGLQNQLKKLRHLQQEYAKLEKLLQRQETEISKRVSIEQQLKLYANTLKTHVEELEQEKADLLLSTKRYIKQLKKTNESLFVQLKLYAEKRQKPQVKSKEGSSLERQKSKHSKSVSHSKARADKGLREAIKAEYIEREYSHSNHQESKRQQKASSQQLKSSEKATSKQANQTLQGARSSQLCATAKKAKGKVRLKKKSGNVFSNLTLLNVLEGSTIKTAHKGKKNLAVTDLSKQQKRKQASKSGSKAWAPQKKGNEGGKSVF